MMTKEEREAAYWQVAMEIGRASGVEVRLRAFELPCGMVVRCPDTAERIAHLACKLRKGFLPRNPRLPRGPHPFPSTRKAIQNFIDEGDTENAAALQLALEERSK